MNSNDAVAINKDDVELVLEEPQESYCPSDTSQIGLPQKQCPPPWNTKYFIYLMFGIVFFIVYLFAMTLNIFVDECGRTKKNEDVMNGIIDISPTNLFNCTP